MPGGDESAIQVERHARAEIVRCTQENRDTALLADAASHRASLAEPEARGAPRRTQADVPATVEAVVQFEPGRACGARRQRIRQPPAIGEFPVDDKQRKNARLVQAVEHGQADADAVAIREEPGRRNDPTPGKRFADVGAVFVDPVDRRCHAQEPSVVQCHRERRGDAVALHGAPGRHATESPRRRKVVFGVVEVHHHPGAPSAAELAQHARAQDGAPGAVIATALQIAFALIDGRD